MLPGARNREAPLVLMPSGAGDREVVPPGARDRDLLARLLLMPPGACEREVLPVTKVKESIIISANHRSFKPETIAPFFTKGAERVILVDIDELQ